MTPRAGCPAWAGGRRPSGCAHIERVAALAAGWADRMARVAGRSARRWLRAVWLHDALRDAPAERAGPLGARRARARPELRHGPASAARAAAEGETDRGVLDAVRYHSVGWAGLGHGRAGCSTAPTTSSPAATSARERRAGAGRAVSRRSRRRAPRVATRPARPPDRARGGRSSNPRCASGTVCVAPLRLALIAALVVAGRGGRSRCSLPARAGARAGARLRHSVAGAPDPAWRC